MIREAGIEIVPLEGVFYNPYMRVNRDITEALAVRLGVRSYADIMAASGIRAFRVARHGIRVAANDINPKAFATIAFNSARLGLDVEVYKKDAAEFLATGGFEFVDLDPFGSPAERIPAAVAARPRILGVTATDTANLCGKYPRAARRLYFAELRKTPFCHEVGLRVILYNLAREAARNDMIIRPLVGYYERHYIRAIVELIPASSAAIEAMFEHIGRLERDPKTYRISVEPGISGRGIGPLRLDDIGDPFVIASLAGFERNSERTEKLLGKLLVDSRAPVGYYDLHEIARIRGESPIPKRRLIEAAEELGLRISETHFSPTAVKATDVGVVHAAREAGKSSRGP